MPIAGPACFRAEGTELTEHRCALCWSFIATVISAVEVVVVLVAMIIY